MPVPLFPSLAGLPPLLLAIVAFLPYASAQTPSPPMSPMWAVDSGSSYCQLTNGDQCFTDGAGSHGNNERCTVRALQPLFATSTTFHTENYFDYLTIHGTRYMGTNGPLNVQMAVGDTASWFSDGSVTTAGFVICGSSTVTDVPPQRCATVANRRAQPSHFLRMAASKPRISPDHIAAAPHTDLWLVVEGSQYCQVINNGACVTDGSGSHGNNERCTVRAQYPIFATATQFMTEQCCDRVSIKGIDYVGPTGPNNVSMAAGDYLAWSSDGSVVYEGFTICAIPSTPPPDPMAIWQDTCCGVEDAGPGARRLEEQSPWASFGRAMLSANRALFAANPEVARRHEEGRRRRLQESKDET